MLLLLARLIEYFLYLMEGLFAENMLNTAGVFQRSFLADSNGHQITGDNLVTLVNASGDGQTGFCQREKIVVIHIDVSVFAESLHGNTDAWLGVTKMSGYIDGTPLLTAGRETLKTAATSVDFTNPSRPST